MYEIRTVSNGYEIDALFITGESQGLPVSGWTNDGMRVHLLVEDLPFALSDLRMTLDNGSYTGTHFYAITAGQKRMMMDALATKVLAMETVSQAATAALVIRDMA